MVDLRGVAAVCAGVVCLALASLGPVPAAAAPVAAPCVTRAEFQQVQKGLTRKQVERVFDTSGRMGDGGAGWYVREYDSCGTGQKPVSITYSINREHPVAHLYRKFWGRPPATGTVPV